MVAIKSLEVASDTLYPAAKAGDEYIISNNYGRIGGLNGIEVARGARVIALKTNKGGTHAEVGKDWMIVHHNGTNVVSMDTEYDIENDLAKNNIAIFNKGNHPVISPSRIDIDEVVTKDMLDQGRTGDILVRTVDNTINIDIDGTATKAKTLAEPIKVTLVGDLTGYGVSNENNLVTINTELVSKPSNFVSRGTVHGTYYNYKDMGTHVYKTLHEGYTYIRLPFTWSDTEFTLTLSGINECKAWFATVSAKVVDYDTHKSYSKYNATVSGSLPFDTIALGHDGIACCVILGKHDDWYKHSTVKVKDLTMYGTFYYTDQVHPSISIHAGSDYSLFSNMVTVPVHHIGRTKDEDQPVVYGKINNVPYNGKDDIVVRAEPLPHKHNIKDILEEPLTSNYVTMYGSLYTLDDLMIITDKGIEFTKPVSMPKLQLPSDIVAIEVDADEVYEYGIAVKYDEHHKIVRCSNDDDDCIGITVDPTTVGTLYEAKSVISGSKNTIAISGTVPVIVHTTVYMGERVCSSHDGYIKSSKGSGFGRVVNTDNLANNVCHIRLV